jgi:uncharacterized protein YeaO (DUF488 family)
MIALKRAYDPVKKSDGTRFLVDHLWPRGLKMETLQAQGWIKVVAPSNRLRDWFGHDPARWKEFQRRYFSELNKNPAAWQLLLHAAQNGNITLVYSARDTEHNNALALKAFLERKMAPKPRRSHGKLIPA